MLSESCILLVMPVSRMNLSALGGNTIVKNFQFHSHQTFFGDVAINLPHPQAEYHVDDTRFFIYKAKSSEEKEFLDDSLRHMVLSARQSYLRYGKVPLLDSYDDKSSIYLARVVYSYQGEEGTFPVEEWLSVRFVRASGVPEFTEDIKVGLYQNKPLAFWLQKKLLNDDPNALEKIMTVSRLCRIPPRGVKGQGSPLSVPVQKNNFTALSFLFMMRIFLEENTKRGKLFEWYTALAKPELFQKVLAVSHSNIQLPFFSATKVLGIPEGEHVRVDRSLLSYQYPGYFLQLDELFSLLQKLIDMRRMTENTLHTYIGNTGYFQDFVELFHKMPYQEFLPLVSGLHRLFLGDGWLEGSRMHKTELRSLTDLCVSDAVGVYLSAASHLSHTVQQTVGKYVSEI